MSQKIVLISVLVIVIAAGGMVFLIFGSKKAALSTPSVVQFSGGGGQNQPTSVISSATLGPKTNEITTKQEGGSFKGQQFVTFFGTSVSIPSQFFESLKPLLPRTIEGQTSQGTHGVAPYVSDGSFFSGKSLSEKEIFEQIWPQNYRDYLVQMKDFMIQDGFISSSQKITFSSDQDIYNFIQLMFSYARAKGWLTDDEFTKFTKDTKEVFPELIQREEDALRSGGAQSLLLPGSQRFSRYSAKNLFSDMLDGFAYILMQAKPAYASWHTKPDCYKDDNPGNKQKGSNSKTFCCNCGYYCTISCVFKEDCGQNGSGCNVQLGCLNRVCQGKPNAIWDKESGTCGCG